MMMATVEKTHVCGTCSAYQVHSTSPSTWLTLPSIGTGTASSVSNHLDEG